MTTESNDTPILHFPDAIVLEIKNERGETIARLDIIEAYDMASTIKAAGEENWLEVWGEWIVDEAGLPSSEPSQTRAMWEQVHTIATEFLESCKKKAKTTSSLLCCSENLQRILQPSRN